MTNDNLHPVFKDILKPYAPKKEMPKKISPQGKVPYFTEGYNQCHDDFTAYLQEALSEERIMKVQADLFGGCHTDEEYKDSRAFAKALREMMGL